MTILAPVPHPTVSPGPDSPNRAQPAPALFEPRTIRIVVVDDHAVVRDGLVRRLGQEPDFDVVGEAEDGPQALEIVRRLRPDVVLMDISLPSIDGIEATRLISLELPGVKIIGLSMFDDESYRATMQRAGAVDCLDKGARADYLIEAVRKHGAASVAGRATSSALWRLEREYAPTEEPLSAPPISDDVVGFRDRTRD